MAPWASWFLLLLLGTCTGTSSTSSGTGSKGSGTGVKAKSTADSSFGKEHIKQNDEDGGFRTITNEFLSYWQEKTIEEYTTRRTAKSCRTIRGNDLLLLIGPQNTYMPARPRTHPDGEEPMYDIQGSTLDLAAVGAAGGVETSIKPGTMSVENATQALEVMNEWIEFMGGKGHIYSVMTYHPNNHCSFCAKDAGGIDPGEICVFGERVNTDHNTSGHCQDTTSLQNYEFDKYVEWPRHAMCGTFGARFDPFLSLPNRTEVFKMGTVVDRYDHSALDAIRSMSDAGEHDVAGGVNPSSCDPSAELDESDNNTLLTRLWEADIDRVFIMGFPGERTVATTAEQLVFMATEEVWDEEEEEWEEVSWREFFDGDATLVMQGTRGHVPASWYLRYKELNELDELKLDYQTDPEDTLEFICSGTCDVQSDCEEDPNDPTYSMWCEPHATYEWGVCTECGCENDGKCTQEGTCECTWSRYGDICSDGLDENIALAIVGVFGFLFLLLVAVSIKLYLTKPNGTFFLEETQEPPNLTIDKGKTYHLFLSHVWSSGQDQVAVIKRRIVSLMGGKMDNKGQTVRGPRVFLDVDDLESTDKLEQYIDETAVVLIFLSRGYFLSRNCLREARAAVEKKKPLVLVHEADRNRGGLPLPEIINECPEELRGPIFNKGYPLIPWLRLGELQIESLRCIVDAMLKATPAFKDKKDEHRVLYLPGSSRTKVYRFNPPQVIFVSEHNPGAPEMLESFLTLKNGSQNIIQGLLHTFTGVPSVEEELSMPKSASKALNPGTGKAPKLKQAKAKESNLVAPTADDTLKKAEEGHGSGVFIPESVHQIGGKDPSRDPPTCMLLYLNKDTFMGDMGDRLAAQIRGAWQLGLPVFMVHENDETCGACDFGRFFGATPDDLVRNGLYKPIAVAWYPGHHRLVSASMLSVTMGAQPQAKRRKSVSAKESAKE